VENSVLIYFYKQVRREHEEKTQDLKNVIVLSRECRCRIDVKQAQRKASRMHTGKLRMLNGTTQENATA
jgi:hypothetical protein